MRRAERLFRIIEKLRPGRLTTARDLAASLEVSERTIYRDIAHLIGSGLPVEGEAGVGYLMREGYDLPPVMFSEEEMVALTAGARMVAAWGGSSMARGAESALEKIAAVVPDGCGRGPNGSACTHGAASRRITPSARRSTRSRPRRTCRIASTSRIPTRQTRVGPRGPALGLWFWGKVWTLVAWCELARRFPDVPARPDHGIDVLDPYTPHPDQDLAAFYRSKVARHAEQAVIAPGQASDMDRSGTIAEGLREVFACRPRPLPCSSRRHQAGQTGQRFGVIAICPDRMMRASLRRLRSAIIRRSSASTE
jgi:biotin operon repressor